MMQEDSRLVNIIYRIGLFLWIPILIVGLVFSWKIYPNLVEGREIFECEIRRTTGVICPGCGGTRAVYYLFIGDIIRSVCYNVTVLYAVLEYIHFMVTTFFKKHHFIKDKGVVWEVYLYSLAGVLIVQWIIKLLLIYF